MNERKSLDENDTQPKDQSTLDPLWEGELVRLRRAEEPDLTSMEEWWNHPELAIFQQASAIPRSKSISIEGLRTAFSNNDPSRVGFAIECRDSADLLGMAVIQNIDPVLRVGHLGMGLAPTVVNRSFGTDTLRVLIRLGFDELNLHKLEAECWEFNPRPIRILEKMGFIEEGRRRAAVFHRGQHWPSRIMGLLRDEWSN